MSKMNEPRSRLAGMFLLTIGGVAILPLGCASSSSSSSSSSARGETTNAQPPVSDIAAEDAQGESVTEDERSSGETPSAVMRTPAEAHRVGVAWLIANQNTDGSWGTYESARPGEIFLDNLSSHRAFRTATTALCVMALIEPSRAEEAVKAALDRGIEYLLTSEPPGRASGQTFYNTWAHTYALEVLSMLARDDRFQLRRDEMLTIAQRELATLAELQGASGAWGYYDFGRSLVAPTGDLGTSFNTSSALLALREARLSGLEINNAMIDAAIRCVEQLRLPSGAYIYGFDHRYMQTAGFNQVKGSLGRAQPCNLALWCYERQITLDDLKTGLDNLRELHHFIEIGRGRPIPHEAWYQTAGYYYFYGHYYAARVIRELDQPDQPERAAWLAGVMAATQDPEGSWFDFPMYGYHRAYGTAFGVMTLEQCLACMEPRDVHE